MEAIKAAGESSLEMMTAEATAGLEALKADRVCR
jgi:hypothetical protein